MRCIIAGSSEYVNIYDIFLVYSGRGLYKHKFIPIINVEIVEFNTVVIINDHQLLSDLLASSLSSIGVESIHSFSSPEDGLQYTLANPPNLLIIDMMLPHSKTRFGESGDLHHPFILMDIQVALRMVKKIRVECPETKIIILNGERHPNSYLLGFEAGADGIASKLDGLDSFHHILNRVKRGERYMMSTRMKKILEEQNQFQNPILTQAEVSVLELVQNGLGNAEIGLILGYSQKTVRNILSGVNKKLGTKNRYQALGLAVDMGLVGWRTGDDEI